ncbi:MAG: 50S ribosomal protein L15 [Fusobacteriaceae bacterium]|nr:50S ribosomal protein L15 [Fusobacteriaceae bacterium]
MYMEKLKPAAGSVKKRKRVGRGPGSGTGKTSTRGHKGQKARKGGTIRLGFEGGQTPLYRRLPKKGFKNSRFSKEYSEINVFMLNNFKDGSVIKIDDYLKQGIVDSKEDKVKILGNGELNKKLEVHADKFSKGAKEKIEKAGGKIIAIEKPKTDESKSKKSKKEKPVAEEKKVDEQNSEEQKKEAK